MVTYTAHITLCLSGLCVRVCWWRLTGSLSVCLFFCQGLSFCEKLDVSVYEYGSFWRGVCEWLCIWFLSVKRYMCIFLGVWLYESAWLWMGVWHWLSVWVGFSVSFCVSLCMDGYNLSHDVKVRQVKGKVEPKLKIRRTRHLHCHHHHHQYITSPPREPLRTHTHSSHGHRHHHYHYLLSHYSRYRIFIVSFIFHLLLFLGFCMGLWVHGCIKLWM